MTLIRIVKDYDYLDLSRQTPGTLGIWNDIEFTFKPLEECDYLIVLNKPDKEGLNPYC